MQSFLLVASLALELVGGQNDPSSGSNVSENTLGFYEIFPKTHESREWLIAKVVCRVGV